MSKHILLRVLLQLLPVVLSRVIIFPSLPQPNSQTPSWLPADEAHKHISQVTDWIRDFPKSRTLTPCSLQISLPGRNWPFCAPWFYYLDSLRQDRLWTSCDATSAKGKCQGDAHQLDCVDKQNTFKNQKSKSFEGFFLWFSASVIWFLSVCPESSNPSTASQEIMQTGLEWDNQAAFSLLSNLQV